MFIRQSWLYSPEDIANIMYIASNFCFSLNPLSLKIKENIDICAPLTKKSSKQVAVENPHHSLNGSFELLLLRLPQFSAVLLQKPQGSSCVCSEGTVKVKGLY